MTTNSDAGTIVTVEGPIDPDDLGVTITHEHTFVDLANGWFEESDSIVERGIQNDPVSMENLSYIRQNTMSHRDNMILDDFETAVDEVQKFALAGGDTIVDQTPKNLGEDPEAVRKVGRATGVQYIHGTAYYTRPAHPDRIDDMTVDELEEEFVSDVREGIGDTDVRAGIVGEIGLSNLIHEQEEKVLRAGARAALRTGAPMNIHPPGRTPKSQQDRTYPTSRWSLDVLDMLEEEGIAPERVTMSHMDRTLFEDLQYQKELAERGPYLEYDLWGTENYLGKYNDSYQSDSWRVDSVMELIDEGYESQLLFSHDVAYKVSLTKYGGFGYAHVLENIVPRLKSRGVSEETIDEILIENPKRALQFVEPQE